MIKKLFKIGVLSLSIATQILAFAPLSYADDDVNAAINSMMKENECPFFDRDAQGVIKEGYLITTIEEPLTLEDMDVTEAGGFIKINDNKKFGSKICFRNSLNVVFTNKKLKPLSIERILKECYSSARELTSNADRTIIFDCKPVQVLISRGGTSLIEGYVSLIYRWAASIGGIIAVAIIVVNGIRISASGGDSQAIENAKSQIIKSISGLVLLFLSALILNAVNPNFFTT